MMEHEFPENLSGDKYPEEAPTDPLLSNFSPFFCIRAWLSPVFHSLSTEPGPSCPQLACGQPEK